MARGGDGVLLHAARRGRWGGGGERELSDLGGVGGDLQVGEINTHFVGGLRHYHGLIQVGEISVHVVGGLRHYHGLVLRATMDPRDHGCVGCGSGT